MRGCQAVIRFFFSSVRLSVLRWTTIFCLGVAFSTPVPAQTTTGRILGSVRDTQDAAIAGAKVTVTDVLRGTSRVLTTDEVGDYVAADLPR